MLHFVGGNIDAQNNSFINWYSMSLNQDFIQMLEKHGRLPNPSTNAYFDEIAKSEALLKKNQILQEQYEELKKEKATTAEGQILQADLKKIQLSNEELKKRDELISKNDEEQKTAITRLDKKV